MATVKFPDGMDPANIIAGEDKLMIAKASTGETMQATWDQAKSYLTVSGAEITALQGGTTANPTILTAPGTTEFRFAQASPGEYKFGSGANMVATPGKMWRIEWVGGVPALKDMGALPKATDGTNGKTIEIFNPAKTSGYSSGDQIFFNDEIFEVKAGQAALTGQSPLTNPEKFNSAFEGGAIKVWRARVYKVGDRVFFKGSIFRCIVATLVTESPETSYKWVDEVKGTQGLSILTLPNTNIDPVTGVFSTSNGYNKWICSDKIPVNLGDFFMFNYILRGGAFSEVVGVFGWDSAGNFIGKPSNINESQTTYTHKDSSIKFIAFQLYKDKNTRLDRLSRDSVQELMYNRYNVNGNYFTAKRENIVGNILINEVIENNRMPLTIGLNTRTTDTYDASNAFRLEKTFASVMYKPMYIWVIIRLKSIDTAGVTSIPFGTNFLKVGEIAKLYTQITGPGSALYFELTTSKTEQSVPYKVEILHVGSEVNNGYNMDLSHKKSYMPMAGIPYSTRSDVSNQTLSLASPLLFAGMITALGDSITFGAEGGAFRILAEDLGMRLTNLGLSGKNLPDILSLSQLDLIARDSDIIFLTGGTNGWFVDGNVDSTDVSNIYGLMNRALDYIFTNIPQAQVVLVTPSQVKTFSTAIRDTAIAFRKISVQRGVMLCDWYVNLGVNPMNASKYIADNVHPNSKQLGYMAYRLKQSIILPMMDARAFNNGPYLHGHSK